MAATPQQRFDKRVGELASELTSDLVESAAIRSITRVMAGLELSIDNLMDERDVALEACAEAQGEVAVLRGLLIEKQRELDNARAVIRQLDGIPAAQDRALSDQLDDPYWGAS
jgi:hypothetical protein